MIIGTSSQGGAHQVRVVSRGAVVGWGWMDRQGVEAVTRACVVVVTVVTGGKVAWVRHVKVKAAPALINGTSSHGGADQGGYRGAVARRGWAGTCSMEGVTFAQWVRHVIVVRMWLTQDGGVCASTIGTYQALARRHEAYGRCELLVPARASRDRRVAALPAVVRSRPAESLTRFAGAAPALILATLTCRRTSVSIREQGRRSSDLKLGEVVGERSGVRRLVVGAECCRRHRHHSLHSNTCVF